MGERIGGEDGSVGGRVGGRCVGGMNSDAYGDKLDGVVVGTAALGVGRGCTDNPLPSMVKVL